MILEAEIQAGSGLSGRRVAEVPWPDDAVLVAVERNDRLIVPRGDLRLEPADRISIFAAPSASKAVEVFVGSSSEVERTTAEHDELQAVKTAT